MKIEGSGLIEIAEWDREKIQDTAKHIVGWYSHLLNDLDCGDWLNNEFPKLNALITMKDPQKKFSFYGRGVSLTYFNPYMVDQFGDLSERYKVGYENDPHFVFSAELGALLPRELTNALRKHQAIGEEAKERFDASYCNHSGIISMPKKYFAKHIYSGKVPLFAHEQLQPQVTAEVNAILKNLNF